MPERYKVVQHDTATYWIKNCHVILVSHAITKDNIQNKVFLQCKFENVGLKRIKALYIKVKCADISQKDLQGVDSFSYLDIDIEQYQMFGDKIPVYLPDKESRCITIIPVRIIFSDDSIWENTFETPFTLAEYEQKPIEELGKLEEQYKRELHKACDSSAKHKFLPIHKDGFIICGCGKILADDATTCPACGSDMEKLLALDNIDRLQADLEQYDKEQAEREKVEKQRQRERAVSRRKHMKIGALIACIMMVVFGVYSIASHISFQNAFRQVQSKDKLISAGNLHSLGLKSDGTVVATGSNSYGQCDITDWKDVVAISAGSSHSLGLKSDGTVVAEGYNSYGECVVATWKDVVAISAGKNHSLGLRSNGTVVATGYGGYHYTSTWKDIVAISAGSNYSLGLKSGGTVVATGSNSYGQCDITDWKDIVAISAGSSHSLGLKSDGTVVATGYNGSGQCDVTDWKDIVAISAGSNHSLGLKLDGTVVATGYNGSGRCDITDWKDIVAISAGSSHSLGLKSDGTVVATGSNDSGECDVAGWKLW